MDTITTCYTRNVIRDYLQDGDYRAVVEFSFGHVWLAQPSQNPWDDMRFVKVGYHDDVLAEALGVEPMSERETILRTCEGWVKSIPTNEVYPHLHKLACYKLATQEQLPTDYLRGAMRVAETYHYDGSKSQWLAFSSKIRWFLGGHFHQAILEIV